MFGKNKALPLLHGHDGLSLWVQEVFPTIQGEGPEAGTPAIFIRLAGCPLKCFYCDTDFESSTWEPSLEELLAAVRKAKTTQSLIVITGGEPFRQNIVPLVHRLNLEKFQVQVETAGIYCPTDPLFHALFKASNVWGNSIVCSPKTPRLHTRLEEYITAYKYIHHAEDCCPIDGLPIKSTQTLGEDERLARPPATSQVPIYLQPMDVQHKGKNKINAQSCAQTAMKHGYRVSIQLHKILDLP